MPDKPLHWATTQAVSSVTVSDTAVDVAAGDSVIISWDHSATVTFVDAPPVQVDVEAGFIARQLGCDDAGNPADGTRGVIELVNTTAGTLTANYTLTRTGVEA